MNQPTDLSVIVEALRLLHLELIDASSSPMDSGRAIFKGSGIEIRVVKDRSQWTLEGKKEELEPCGLWRAFDSTSEFRDALVEYVRLLAKASR